MMSVGLPVLAFHSIGPGKGPTWFDARAFAVLIDELLEAGFAPVNASVIGEFLAGTNDQGKHVQGKHVHGKHVHGKHDRVSRPVAFTFDDGYQSVLGEALPILAARNVTATVFVVTGAPGRNDWDAPGSFGGGLPLLDRSGIERLVEAGWEVGSHTHTHKRLRGIAASDVARELDLANEALASIGVTTKTMAYPYGAFDTVSSNTVREHKMFGFTVGARYAQLGCDTALIDRIDACYLKAPLVQHHLGDSVGASLLAGRQALRDLRNFTSRRSGNE